MIELSDPLSNDDIGIVTQDSHSAHAEASEEAVELQASLELFDFSLPLPEKGEDVLRIYYNNCKGIEINSTIEAFLKQQKEKKNFNILQI